MILLNLENQYSIAKKFTFPCKKQDIQWFIYHFSDHLVIFKADERNHLIRWMVRHWHHGRHDVWVVQGRMGCVWWKVVWVRGV